MAGTPQISPLLTVALVLIAGLLGGALARRVRLPGITGQILVGVLLGPVLRLFEPETVGG